MKGRAYPHLLVAIGGNRGEWLEALSPTPDRPRLPLPYAFGAALINAGFRLSAIDFGKGAKAQSGSAYPFETIYPADALGRALRSTDVALLWGRPGLLALMRRAIWPRPRYRLFYFPYAWAPRGTSTTRQRMLPVIARHAARFATGITVMTAEQAEAVRAELPRRVSVVQLTVGVDVGFYSGPSVLSDVGRMDLSRVEHLMHSPYVIMPGDELRLNEDALAIVERSPLNLVRISQYGHKNAICKLKAEIRRRNLGHRLFVFERIEYPVLRFLMRRAAAYAGLVDASWQPAGWTVACESLASGLPVVLYEGLVARELVGLGASPDIVRSVPMRDTRAFAAALESVVECDRRKELGASASAFAAQALDMERTGTAFGQRLMQAIGVG